MSTAVDLAPPRRRRPRRPERLLTQNSELRDEGIWNWTLPALATRLRDGRTVKTCPAAGVCALACYARNGTYLFPGVVDRHQRNLEYVLDDLPGWQRRMAAELAHPRHQGGWVRIHDAGDFLSDHYLAAWLRIMIFRPGVNFYGYTKEVARVKRMVAPNPPRNFRWVYSYGGREDHLLDPTRDRVADVYPDEAAIRADGWHSQDSSDLLAVLGPAPVGIPSNNIPAFRRRMNGRTFRAWQAERDARGAARRGSPQMAPPVGGKAGTSRST
ncbi:GP88 family protein [Streptomyces mirabilis]|uniref:GP88 family protein n=1 Tax=Streptomyces mirabilis TaxID=68239 RepID=UPI0033BD0590